MCEDKSGHVANIKTEIVSCRYLLQFTQTNSVSDHMETSEQLKVSEMSSDRLDPIGPRPHQVPQSHPAPRGLLIG